MPENIERIFQSKNMRSKTVVFMVASCLIWATVVQSYPQSQGIDQNQVPSGPPPNGPPPSGPPPNGPPPTGMPPQGGPCGSPPTNSTVQATTPSFSHN